MNCIKKISDGGAACLPYVKWGASFVTGMAAAPLFTVIHEYTHLVAVKALVSNANPSVVLENWGYDGGYCRWGIPKNAVILSPLGKIFGRDTSYSLIAASGPVVQAAFLVAMAAYLENGSPLALCSAINLTLYSLMSDAASGDFSEVSDHSGPLASAALTAFC